MASFDSDKYFAQRAKDLLLTPEFQPQQDPVLTKMQQVADASNKKKADFLTKLASDIEAQQIANASSISSQLGLDPTEGLGLAVNSGAQFLDGGVRLAKNFMAGIHDNASLNYGTHLSTQAIEAGNRWAAGKATDEDMAILSQATEIPMETGVDRVQWGNAKETNLDRYKKYRETAADAQVIRDKVDVSHLVNNTNTKAFQDSLGVGFRENAAQLEAGWDEGSATEVVSGLAGLLANIGEAALTNKAGAMEYVVNNLPQLLGAAAGAGGMALTNIPYAVDAFGQGIQEYQKKNGGAMPSAAQLNEMALEASTLAMAETVGDKLTLGLGKAGKLAGKVLGSAEEGAEAATRSAFKKALSGALDSAPGRIAKQAAGAAVGEFATEAYQTGMEEHIKGNEASAEEIYIGGAIGAVSGGVLGGGVQTLKEAAAGSAEYLAKAAKNEAERAAIKAAIESGDATPFMDREASTYDPVKAVQVLHGSSAKPETSPEDRQANLAKATEALKMVDEDVETVRERMQLATPEGLRELLAVPGISPERKAALEAILQKREETPLSKEQIAAVEKAFKEKEAIQKTAQDQVAQMHRDLGTAPATEAEVATTLEQATTEVDPVDTAAVATKQEAAKKVFTLAMAAAPNLDAESLDLVINDTTNGLGEQERSFLRKVSDARRLERESLEMSDVSRRIFEGEGRDIGIAQYRERIGQALASGDRALAASYLQKLSGFAIDHEAKASAAADALRTKASIIRGKLPGSWQVAARKPTKAELDSSLGLEMYSPKLATAIQFEARAIRAAEVELNAAYDLAFSAAPSQSSQSTQAAPAASVTTNTQGSRGVNQSNVDVTVNQTGSGAQTTSVADTQQAENPASTQTAEPSNTTESQLVSEEDLASQQEPSTPPWEGQSEFDTASIRQQIQAGRDTANKSVGEIRDLTPAEQAVLNTAVATFNEKVGDWAVEAVDGFFTFDSIDGVTTAGFVYPIDGKVYVAIKASMLGEAGQLLSQVGAHTHADAILTHEMGHVIDIVFGGENGFSGRKAFQPGGSILSEVTNYLASEQATEFLKGYLGYTLEQSNPVQVSRELFAQLYALYILNPEIMNAAFKTTTQSFDSIFGRGAATESRSEDTVSDGELPSGQRSENDGEPAAEGNQEVGLVETEEVTEEAADPSVPEGTLEVMQREPSQSTFPSEVAKERKLFATFFKQLVNREGDTSLRPLVAVKNFMSRAMDPNDPVTAWDYIPFDREQVTDAQKAFLMAFRDFAEGVKGSPGWSNFLGVSMQAPTEAQLEHVWKDLPQELLFQKEDGSFDLEQNVKTAMSYAVFSWIAEAGSTPLRKERSEVASMLGLEDESELSDELYEQFRYMDMRSARLASDLGKRFTEALGLSAKNQDTPADFLPRLQAAMGTHLILAMQQYGLMKEEELLDGEKIHRFVQLQRNTDVVQNIVSKAVGSKGILNQLFSVQERRPMPSLAPVPFNQATTVSGQEVPKTEQEIIKAHNEQENRLRPDTWNVVRLFSEGNMASLAGGKAFQAGKHHVGNEFGMTAKRDALLREIRDLKEFVGHSLMGAAEQLSAPFYLMHEVWKQQRVGILNRINPQMSKVHRHSMYRENGKAELDIENPEHMGTFKLRVLEGLGIKTSHEANAKSLLRMTQLFDPSLSTEGLTTDEIAKLNTLNAAVEVLMRLEGAETLSEQDQQAVLAGVEAGGEAMLSLDALMAVAALRKAKKQGLTTFTSYLMGEIDGVTNGPILSHLMYGAKLTEADLADFLQKGGIYSEESGIQHYNEWRAQSGKHDLYETMTAKAFEILATLTASAGKRTKLFETVKYFTGDLVDKDSGRITSAGRNLSKEPIRPLIFGSGIGKAISNMSDAFVDSILKTFEKMDESKVSEAIDKLNYLIFEKDSNVPKIPTHLTKQEFLQHPLSSEQRRLIAKSFQRTFGAAFEKAIESELGTFLERRTLITKASAAIFAMYETTYNALREQYVQELIAKGKIESRQGKDKLLPAGDLTPRQERAFKARIRKLHPTVHTVMSKMDGQLTAGLPVFDSDVGLSEDPAYTTEVHINGAAVSQFRKDPATGKFLLDKAGNKIPLKTRKVSAMWRRVSSPKVSLISMPIHAMDSAISHLANALGLRYNMHDAQGTGVLDFTPMGQAMNKALWDTALNYSPLMELFEVMERTLRETQNVLSSKTAPEGLKESLAEAIMELADKTPSKQGPVDPHGYLTRIFNELFQTAITAEVFKTGVMSQAAVFDQYASEGARYVVTPEDRAAALARKNKYAAKTKPNNASLVVLQKLEAQVEGEIDKRESEAQKEAKMAWQQAYYGKLSVEGLRVLIGSTLHNLTAPAHVRTQLNSLLDRLKTASVEEALGKASLANRHLMFDAFDAFRGKNPKHAKLANQNTTDRNDSELVSFFEANTQRSVKETLEFLQSRMAEGSKGFAGFTKLLNARLLQWVTENNLNINIRYVTPVLSAEFMLDNPNARGEASHGWYSTLNGQEEIYFLGRMYADSKLTPELVLHEILHAILSSTIEAGKSSLVKDLKSLLKLAQDFVAGTEHAKTFEKALSNVHEFVSYGMTNEAFQEVVLKQLKVSEETKKISGFRSFVKSVTKFLFGDKEAKAYQTNGLMHFMQAVAGLLEKTRNEEQTTNATHSMAAPTYHTTVDVFNALGQSNLTPGFADHLKGLLTGIVKAIYKDAGSYDGRVVYQPDPVAMWEAAKRGNAAPFASSVLAAPFNTDEATAFALEQVEATVMASLEDEHGQATFAYKELSRLYQEARTKLKPADFMDASGDAQLAQERWNFVFQAHQVTGKRSNYLARFAALGLAHPEVNKLLNFSTSQKTERVMDGKTVADKVKILFEKILRFFATKATQTFDGQIADQKLATLTKQLIQLELDRREVLASKGDLLSDRLGDFADKNFSKLRSKIGDVAESDFFANNRFAVVRALSTAASLTSRDRVAAAMKVVEQIRNRMIKDRHGILMGIINDVKQAPRKFIQMLRQAKLNEQERKFVITQVGRIALEGFVDKGKHLTKEAKAAITSVFLRTDMAALMETYGLERLNGFMTKQQVLLDEIRNIEHQLKGFPLHQHFYSTQAKVLAWEMVSGKVAGRNILFNAYSIARLHGTEQQGKILEADALRAEPLIDALVSLYAISYTAMAQRKMAAKVLADEMARPAGENGVETVLRLHRQLQQDARERLFQTAPNLMRKGYLAEIVNQRTEVVTATALEGRELLEQGWEKIGDVKQDPLDPDQTQKGIYSLKYAGLVPYQTGYFSLTSKQAKGSYARPQGARAAHSVIRTRQLAQQARIDARSLFQPNPGFDPRTVTGNFSAPLFNENGDVVDFRYMMAGHIKDSVLERNNNFDDILGMTAGSNMDKMVTPEQNREGVLALKALYDADYRGNASAYVYVGATSTDPELREMYRTLPYETREAIRAIWGSDGMQVRVDVLDITFGYRERSLSKIFEKSRFTMPEAAFVKTVEGLLKAYAVTANVHRLAKGKTPYDVSTFHKRAPVVTRRVEEAWQELAHEVKDAIVIKTGTVLGWNIVSNVSMLYINGVPLKDMVRLHREAIDGYRRYQQDNEELYELQTRLHTKAYGNSTRAELEYRVMRLEDSIDRNPVKPLIDAGLKPTIVEDVEADRDDYSYKSLLAKKAEKYTSKLNKHVLEASKIVLMTHDTSVYQSLHTLTQMSDFVARYALYQHLITKRNALSKEDAIEQVADSFVNYDIPLTRNLQYLDKMGVAMFVKYFLRIQKVIFQLIKEHPTRAIGMVLANQLFDTASVITDSSILARIDSLTGFIHSGALEYPSTFDDLATVNLGLSVLR